MKEVQTMNTDKIFAEQIANEYAPKDTSKVVTLRKLDAKESFLQSSLPTRSELFLRSCLAQECALPWVR